MPYRAVHVPVAAVDDCGSFGACAACQCLPAWLIRLWLPGRLSLGASGDAWSDPLNPIRQIFKGQRLDLWSLQAVSNPSYRRSKVPTGRADQWIASLRRNLTRTSCRPLPRRTGARWCGGLFRSHRPAADAEEVRAFVDDDSPDAYERLVDRLLASPALRRALGAAVARRRPLLRQQRLRLGRVPPAGLAVPRLRHPLASTPTSRSTGSSASNSPAMSCSTARRARRASRTA